MKLIAAIFCIIFLLFGNNSEHVCRLPKLEEPSFGVHSGSINKRYFGRQHLKITTYYDRTVINSDAAAQIVGCYHRKYAETWQEYEDGEGIAPNELIILVKHNISHECDVNTFAWGGFCIRDPESQRPIIGIVNYCKTANELIMTEKDEVEATTKHEIAHVLGFIKNLFSRYEDISKKIVITKEFYDVDFSMAEDFTWGKGLGCDFVMKSCNEFIRSRKSRGLDIAPFCEKDGEIMCSQSLREYGVCGIDTSFSFTDRTKYPGFDDNCMVVSVSWYIFA
ncbi:unnamed protein product [Schistosoma turkestanicum]|nr:unnamed protein product [Schistosoma turkestanicum]